MIVRKTNENLTVNEFNTILSFLGKDANIVSFRASEDTKNKTMHIDEFVVSIEKEAYYAIGFKVLAVTTFLYFFFGGGYYE